MKGKKLLAILLSAAMVIGTMVMPAFAEDSAAANTVTEIANAQQFREFADSVNSGKSYKGETVVLTDDIDLENESWKPIGKMGNSFQGTFDGQGHTIKNLKAGDSWTNDVGLFGYTTVGAVKNFTLENVDVTGHMDVGAVAGTPYTSKYSNIVVKGEVKVNGFSYVGGAFGKNAYANIDNVDIIANEGSYVKAESTRRYRTYLGGLVGFMGEGSQVVSNCDVKIDVIGSTCDIGGILGILHYGNTIKDCTFEGNLTLSLTNVDPGDEKEFGAIAGVVHNQKGTTNKIINCSAKVGTAMCKGEDITDTIKSFGDFYIKNPTGQKHLYSATVNDVKTVYYEGISEDELKEQIGDENILVDNVVKNYNEIKENENITPEEKTDIVENTAIIDEASAEKAADLIKDIPTEEKENISVEKVKEIAKKTSSAVTKTHENITVTAINPPTASNVITDLNIVRNDEQTSLKQPETVNAIYFDVTLQDSDGNYITETDVPVYVEIEVGDDVSKVEKVLRSHNGVIEELPFVNIGDGKIAVTSAKFSDFVLIMNQNVTSGQAVLTFKEDTAAEDYTARFNMYLTADDAETVSRFESGEFKLEKTGTSDIAIAPATGLTIDYSDLAEKYKVYRPDGENAYPDVIDLDGKKAILLGTVTLTGVGSGTISTSDIKMYQKSNDGENLAIDIDALASATTAYEIKPATQKLVIKVTYPNNIKNNETNYQDMTVSVKGTDFEESYKLGTNAAANVVWSEAENSYTVTIEDKLCKNTAYSVEVSGAGYRTARYTVTMNTDKTLNFWNNAKDTAAAVEEGNPASEKRVTFLAGDIVKDNKINIYDLSAVVSYFGEDNLVSNHPEYAKYDLNRDGKIDSKDVAYVLVSWGE